MPEMKTLTINGITYEVVDGTARTASGTLFADGETFQQKYDNGKLTGPAYTLTDTDKDAIAAAVKDSLNTETWTFTLEDGSTVTKAVYVG